MPCTESYDYVVMDCIQYAMGDACRKLWTWWCKKKNALKSAQQYELATANSYLACEKHSGRCPGCKKVFLEMA